MKFKDYESFNVVLIDDTVECSLKHLANNFLSYGQKWSHLGNDSLTEWLEKNPLTNIDLSFSEKELKLPEYFSRTEAPVPEDFSDWSLSESYNLSIIHVTEKPKFMQPKSNKCT